MRRDGTPTSWDAAQWARIEAEFGEPAREVVRAMHHADRVPLRHVGGALEVSEHTLRQWCAYWGLRTLKQGEASATPVMGKVQRRARELGYASVSDAIQSLRVTGHRWNEVKAILQCGEATMCRYYPDSARGYQHVSPEGLAVKRELARRLNAAGRNGRMPALSYVVPRHYRRN